MGLKRRWPSLLALLLPGLIALSAYAQAPDGASVLLVFDNSGSMWGKVEGDEIRGTVTVTPPEGKAQQLPWVARRGSAASWFRTTGVNIK